MKKTTLILLGFLAAGLFAQRPIVGLPVQNGVYDLGGVRFKWDLSSCGGFELQIDADSNFSAPQVYFTAGNDTSISFTATGNYYFRVRCLQGDFSTAQQLEVIDINQMGSIVLWLKADSGITLDNGLVSSWRNLSDTTTILSQNNSNSRPQFLPEGFMGNPAVRFGKNGAPGEATWLNFNAPMQVDTFTFFQSCQQLSSQIHLQHTLGGVDDGFHLGGTHAGGKNTGFWDGQFERVAKQSQSISPRIIAQKRSAIYGNFSLLNTITGGSGGQPIGITAMGVRPDYISLTYAHALFSEILLFGNDISHSSLIKINQYLASKNAQDIGLPYDTLACGSSIFLSVKYPGNYQNVIWSNGNTGANSTYTVSGWHWVRATNHFGVIQTDSFFVGGVFPAPIIKESGLKALCLGDTVLQAYLNPDPVQPWMWNNGANSDTLVLTNPGFYWLLQTDSSGCVLSSDTLELVNRVNADILVFSVRCNGDTTVFSDNSYDVFGNQIQQFYWDFGPSSLAIDSLAPIGKAIFYNSGPQTIRLIVANDVGCVDTAYLIIQIPAAPQALFSPSVYCSNTPILLSNQSSIPSGTSANQFIWYVQGFSPSNQVSPTVSFLDTGTYAVSLKVSLNNGCSDSTHQNIQINKKVQVEFALENDTVCAGDDLQLINATTYVNTNRGTATWTLKEAQWQGDTVVAIAAPPGKQIFQLDIQSLDGCKGQKEADLWIVPLPKAELFLSQTLGVPPIELLIWDSSSGAGPLQREFSFNDTVFWNQTPPSVILNDTGEYFIWLRVVDETGCADSVKKQIRVIEPRLRFVLKKLNCQYQNGGLFTTFELENQSDILPITEQKFEFWTDLSTPLGFSYNQKIAPGSFYGFAPEAEINVGKQPNYCCIKPIQIISEYQPGFSLIEQGSALCNYLGEDDFFVSLPSPNPSAGKSKVFVFSSNLIQPIFWSLVTADGKVMDRGQIQPKSFMQELTFNADRIPGQAYILEIQQGDKAFRHKGIIK